MIHVEHWRLGPYRAIRTHAQLKLLQHPYSKELEYTFTVDDVVLVFFPHHVCCLFQIQVEKHH